MEEWEKPIERQPRRVCQLRLQRAAFLDLWKDRLWKQPEDRRRDLV